MVDLVILGCLGVILVALVGLARALSDGSEKRAERIARVGEEARAEMDAIGEHYMRFIDDATKRRR